MLAEGIHVVIPFKPTTRCQFALRKSNGQPACPRTRLGHEPRYFANLPPGPGKSLGWYQKIGPNHQLVLIEPNLRAAIREATASHTANALYTGEREMVAKQIFDQVSTQLNQRGLTVENVLLRDIQLPTTLKSAIEAKQQAEQESLAMNFRLQKETQEAQRKRIEAAGVRDFQQIVAQGITPSLLEWKGIEATENLAKSPNSKVVVIGNSKNGLPLILGQ